MAKSVPNATDLLYSGRDIVLSDEDKDKQIENWYDTHTSDGPAFDPFRKIIVGYRVKQGGVCSPKDLIEKKCMLDNVSGSSGSVISGVVILFFVLILLGATMTK